MNEWFFSLSFLTLLNEYLLITWTMVNRCDLKVSLNEWKQIQFDPDAFKKPSHKCFNHEICVTLKKVLFKVLFKEL
jgi:hypothetical protein